VLDILKGFYAQANPAKDTAVKAGEDEVAIIEKESGWLDKTTAKPYKYNSPQIFKNINRVTKAMMKASRFHPAKEDDWPNP
jgi:hypothetical protein